MMRKRHKGPLGASDLRRKAGVIDNILWPRKYINQLVHDYPKILEVAESVASAVQVQKVKALIQIPLAMYELMDSGNRDATLSQFLPNEPLRLFCNHLHDVCTGFYAPEVKGALSSPPEGKWNVAMFHDTVRVKKRFWDGFLVAHDSLWATNVPPKKEPETPQEDNNEKAK
ncbi:hypothetical protein N9L68_07260 [bacterium]|nr:hypothetical protein [bacterium]